MLNWLDKIIKRSKRPDETPFSKTPPSQPESRDQADKSIDRGYPWYMYYNSRTSSKGYSQKGRPKYAVGQSVRIVKKPERARRILEIEWHYEREEWVYKIELFKYGNTKWNNAYWFEPQLIFANLIVTE